MLVAAGLIGAPVVVQAAPASVPAAAAPMASRLERRLEQPGNAELRRFYYYRGNRPLWVVNGRLSPAALELAELVRTASLDGVGPEDVFAGELEEALRRTDAEGTPEALDMAEVALSRSFAAYIRQTRHVPEGVMRYEHVSLQPQVPSMAAALQDAAKAASLAQYVHDMGWLHPLYAPLRRAFAAAGGAASPMRHAYLGNLARLRTLPAVPPGGRYVLVNAAAARLWMYQDGEAVDSMKVVVGKVENQTPIMAGYIRYAIVNPYWNVPADFTRDKIASRVLKGGIAYLRKGDYEVLSDWTEEASVIDPATVDWKAVAAGKIDLRVRQRPGAANSMGKVKFEFPNPLGIYLHDTPQTDLMARENRLYSAGCVRLEDAQRLGRWLFQGSMPSGGLAEERFDLPRVVPVYVTYLTLQAGADGQVVALGDPYGRDDHGSAPALAAQSSAIKASR